MQDSRKVPTSWRNFLADFRRYNLDLPLPSRRGEKGIEPVTLESLARTTSTEAARIELLQGPYGQSPHIPIPPEVLELYRTYRPTPFFRAAGLEKVIAATLGKERLEHASIYIKDESRNPGGSHKINTAIAQALYLKRDGKTGVVTDTGAGQWGVAVSIAAKRLGLDARIFMTAQSYQDKQGRVREMEENGARVVSSPSPLTEIGRRERERDPDHPGSLGIGMSEAFSVIDEQTGLALGCMSYYAALHQSVIGLEVQQQLAAISRAPDVLVACIGGGSNFCGLVAPYVESKLAGRGPVFVAAESANIPVLTQGAYRWDHQDHGELMAMLLMYTLGHENIPPKHHSGGLRYHGKNPALSLLHQLGHVKVASLDQREVLRAGLQFSESEGFVPAPESAHAILAGIREAAAYELRGEKRNIVVLLSGRGDHDHVAYESLRKSA
jgi:tryptophan synthase beta chain